MSIKYRGEDERCWGLEFGRNLQKVISSSNITQQQLARKLGTTDAMISRYIYGISIPSVYKACQIAKVLGCAVSDLIKPTYDE